MQTERPTVRLATTDEDRAAVYRLRYEIYVEAQGLFTDQADHDRRILCDEYDDHSWIFIAEHGGRCVGTSRMTFGSDVRFTEESREEYDFAHFEGVLEEADLSVISRLMMLPEYRGGDLGTRLFAASFGLAAARGAELVLGACELFLINYYWGLGFRPFGALSNHVTNGVRVRIAVVLGDLDHVMQMGSPMTHALARRNRSTENVPAILHRMAQNAALTSQTRLGSEAYHQEVMRRLGTAPVPEPLTELPADDLSRLLQRSHLMTCAPGDTLFFDGQASRTLYILLSGSLEVHDPATGHRRIDRVGALVGEVALLGSSRRLGNVAAGAGGATVLTLDDRHLRKLLAKRDMLAAIFLAYASCELSRKLIERGAVAPAPLRTPHVKPAPRTTHRAVARHRRRLRSRRYGTGRAKTRAAV